MNKHHSLKNILNIKLASTKILNRYAQLLIQNIKKYGFVPELLNLSQKVNFSLTQSLCQSRSIFYLSFMYQLSGNDKYLNYALFLQKKLKNNYFENFSFDWRQYPNRKIMNNLYEYAFLLFGYSHLYQASKKKYFIFEIKRLYSIVNRKFISNNFSILFNQDGIICQNALMHLFEALLAAFRSTKFSLYKNTAKECYKKIIFWFYHRKKNLISEYLNRNGPIYEPGHNFEWACLIYQSQELGIILPKFPCFKEIAKNAEDYGIANNNLVKSEINSNSTIYRIWPTLERLRYYTIIKNITRTNQIFTIFNKFFIIHRLPVEYVDYDGNSKFTNIKSTTGYHLINALHYYYINN